MTGTPSYLNDQHVLILGLGVSGLAMARWCVRAGAKVTVADTRAEPPQLATLRKDLPGAHFVAGSLDAALMQDAKLCAVFKSPGLTPFEVTAISEAARAHGITMAGELSLFSKALAQLRVTHGYQPKVLAVTGTNGKTTVTSLTTELVRRAGKTVAMAGNVGPTLLDTLSARLDADTLPEVWVLELSSFQLDGESSFEPSAAALLNITQDHLDWHGSMQHYSRAKANIFGQQALLILNREDPVVMGLLSAAGPPQGAKAPSGGSAAHAMASMGVTRSGPIRIKSQRSQDRNYLTFGADRPTRPGDFGMQEVNGMLWLVRALPSDETSKKSRNSQQDLHLQRLMPADALRIRGRHNALNALAALALGQTAGCALGPTLFGLREYRGEPHRLESVAIVNDVEYFDDSKGTNVGATAAALSGFGPERRVVAILGGEGKGQDFSPLAPVVARHARAVVLIGRAASELKAVLGPTGVTLTDAGSMEQAVRQASTLAQAGDAVLLSPACASFDMFDNYEHRARAFLEAVMELANAGAAQTEGAL